VDVGTCESAVMSVIKTQRITYFARTSKNIALLSDLADQGNAPRGVA